ncbi:centrosomal protein of 131 kDa-like isoform X2 [Rhopilema esculentum]|uniref:centrosomal protein of 131 kDa-like isoform X2 n=1 Tax=Rhopilema esculentum TaxID=499914 RepID=UPI0031DE523A
MASRRQRPLSANFVSVGSLRENKGTPPRSGIRTPPNKVKTPLTTSRSNISQTSNDPADGLSITGSGVGSARTKNKRGENLRGSLGSSLRPNEVQKPAPKIMQKDSKTHSGTKGGSATSQRGGSAKNLLTKPAWFVSTDGISNETPRSDTSKATFSVIPPRPSVDEFLDSEVRETKKESPRRNELARSFSNPARYEDQSASVGFLDQAALSKIGHLLENISNDSKLSDVRKEPEFDKPSKSFGNKTSATTDSNHWPNYKEDGGDPEDLLFSQANKRATKTRDSKTHVNSKVGGGKSTVHRSWGSVEGIETKTDDYLIARREKAAIVIQRWYRRVKIRKTAGAAAMKRMMDAKRKEVEARMSYEKEEFQVQHNAEVDKIKRREEKARLARQAAIEDLQKKREEKKTRNQAIAQQEIAYLQESGKISKQKSQPKSRPRQKRPDSASSAQSISNGKKADGERDLRPPTASSVGRKVDEIFEGSSHARSHKDEDTDIMLTDRTAGNDETTVSKAEEEVKGSKTTFEDLLDTLKELESEPPELSKQRKSYKDAWINDTDGKNERHSLTTQNLRTLSSSKDDRMTNNPLLTADKLRSIIDFLDEVEQAEQDIRSELSRSRVVDSVVSEKISDVFEGVLSPEKDMDSASQIASEISKAISEQKEQLNDKNRSVNLLQKALQQQREFSSTHIQEVSKEHKQQLSLQRQEYESTIQRHLSFIDQLIDDKKVLSQRCEDLVKKLKETDQKYSTKLKTVEENHAVELKKQKEVMEAAEKLRREKWIQEKTIQIKEMTVKGLEPDIQKLIAKHKAEIKKLKAMHQGELLEADERAGRKYIRQIEELREQLEIEKDQAVQRERDIARQRYEKQLEQEEQAYQQQRRRLYSEVQEEKERLTEQLQKTKQETTQEKNASEESYRHTLLAMQEDHHKKLEEIERRHTSEMSNLKEQLEIEKQQWIENYMKKQDTYLLAKERELKEGVREARDKEIEMVISRLEKETAEAKEECERAADNRIKRIRDKYENEMKELENSERSYQERYGAAKERSNDLENETIRLRSQLKQKDQEVIDIKKLTEQLQSERGKATDIIRQEFADRLVTTDEDNKRLRNDISELKARQRLEIDRVVKEKEDEMEEVHKRVKMAISKKEETVQMLRHQMQAAEKRADHLEMLLAEQRKKLMR